MGVLPSYVGESVRVLHPCVQKVTSWLPIWRKKGKKGQLCIVTKFVPYKEQRTKAIVFANIISYNYYEKHYAVGVRPRACYI